MNPFRILGKLFERSGEENDRTRLERIGAEGDVRALVEMLPFLPAHSLSGIAADAAAKVLARCSPSELAAFDGWYRAGYGPKGPIATTWRDLKLGASTPFPPAVIALASFHANGFVREQAVRRLGLSEDGSELPYLLLRLNDWVVQVQVVALRAIDERVTPVRIADWMRCLPLVEQLRGSERRRSALAQLFRRVDGLLLDASNRARLQESLLRGALPMRRACLRLVLQLATPEAKPLLALATRDCDPNIAICAARALVVEATDAVLGEMLAHRHSTVRRLALERALARNAANLRETQEHASAIGTTDIREMLELALLDEARAIRELARYELARREPAFDVAARYRDALDREGKRGIVAFEALAEISTAADVDFFLRHVISPNARLRAAAIAAVGRLAGEAHLDVLEAAISDRSYVVRRAALPSARRHLGRRAVRAIGR